MDNNRVRNRAISLSARLIQYGIRSESPEPMSLPHMTGEERRLPWRINTSHRVFPPELVREIAENLRDHYLGRDGPPLEFFYEQATQGPAREESPRCAGHSPRVRRRIGVRREHVARFPQPRAPASHNGGENSQSGHQGPRTFAEGSDFQGNAKRLVFQDCLQLEPLSLRVQQSAVAYDLLSKTRGVFLRATSIYFVVAGGEHQAIAPEL